MLRGLLVAIVALSIFGVSAARAADEAAPSYVAHGAHLRLEATALSDDIVRFRLYPKAKRPEDASWSVAPDVRARRAGVSLTADGFSTADIVVHVGRDLRVRIEDKTGKILLADAAEGPVFDGARFTLRKDMAPDERYFAFGDKAGGFDRRGGAFVNWNTDAYGFDRSTDPLYKSIPFFISTGAAGAAYGLFLDNTWRSWFDFGQREENVLAFGSAGGPVDYYFIAGPTVKDVVRRYADLTGRPPLPPLWALGYQQSRYSYESAEEVRALIRDLRAARVPTDVVWLDIDYQDRNRPFTVNKETFPDLAALTKVAAEEGVKLITIVDPHVARAPGEGYAPYESGLAAGNFLRTPEGEVYTAPVWPGPAVFPDFTREEVRRWWGGLYKSFLDAGVAGIWNDMNEPAVFETPTKTAPLDVVHRIAGDGFASRDATHAEIHNIYGLETSRATYEGLRLLRPDERAFVMTRASFAGGQKYAVTWTGDNSSTWDHLKLSVSQLINLGLSGFAYSAADVGGFTGGPSPDLLTRWFEIGAFTPVFRDHSAKNTPRAEPWVDGMRHLDIRRRYVEARYRLLPYFYALADDNVRTGDPLMRPVFYDYPGALSANCGVSSSFTLGEALLIAPGDKPESDKPYTVCLPAGAWYDYWTGAKVSGKPRPDGASEISVTPRLERLPVYVRAGAIVPRQPLVESTAETPKGPLELHVYPDPDCRGALYFDDGHSTAYETGGFWRQKISCAVTADGGVSLTFAPREGTFSPWWTRMEIVVHGWTARGATATNTGAALAGRVDRRVQEARVDAPALAEGGVIIIAPK